METNPLKTCIDRLLKVLPTDADSLNAGLSLCETRSDLLHWVEIDLAEHPDLYRRCVPVLQQLGSLGGDELSVDRVRTSVNAEMLCNDLACYLRDIGIQVTTDWKHTSSLLRQGGVEPIADLHHQVCGLVYDNVLYINPQIADLSTPIHEYTHLWSRVLRWGNPDEWEHIVNRFRSSSEWETARDKYPHLQTDDQLAEELLADYSGKQGADFLTKLGKLVDNETTTSRGSLLSDLFSIRQALRHFWQEVADFLHIRFTSTEEVAAQIMRDFLSGVNPLEKCQSLTRLPASFVGVGYSVGEVYSLDKDFTPEMKAIIDQAKAAGTVGLAPNGQSSNLDLRQWAQVRTKAFKSWFGDWESDPAHASKVVDRNGEPMVVYHGTREGGFSEFSNDHASKHSFSPVGAIWFSNDLDRARSYSGTRSEVTAFGEDEECAGVYSCFLNVREMVISDFDGADWEGTGHELYELRMEDEQGHFVDLVQNSEGFDYFKSAEEAEAEAERLGLEYYSIRNNHFIGTNVNMEAGMVLDQQMGDGLLITNVIDNGRFGGDEVADDYVVFSPYQIKSASCNMGQFDPLEADIRYQLLEQTSTIASPTVWKALAVEIDQALQQERDAMEKSWLNRLGSALKMGAEIPWSAESERFVRAYSGLCRLSECIHQFLQGAEIAQSHCVSRSRGR